MKIIFAGTPEFAANALEALLASEHEIVAILTQPDRPAGRGMQLAPSPVKRLALQNNIPVMQPVTLKDIRVQQQLSDLHADVMVVAAYGLILPLAVLQTPRQGCLNIHASLLPRWRGAAPIQRALLAGDSETGITIMQMDTGLDTGAMLINKICHIDESDNAQTLHDKLAALGSDAILEALCLLTKNNLKGQAQNSANVTYAAKLSKMEAKIDWSQRASQIGLAVRAYNPYPVAYTLLNDTTIKIWQAKVSDEGDGEPGMVLGVDKNGIRVACGEGSLYLQVLQRPNAKALPAKQFLQGFMVKAGDHFSVN